LDLGRTTDYTALVVLERLPPASRGGYGGPPRYWLRHLERYIWGADYTALVRTVARLVRRAPLSGKAILVVDQKEVGRPVVDMLVQQSMPARVMLVTIRGGQVVRVGEGGVCCVPKREPVSSLHRLLHGRRLKVVQTLAEAGLFQTRSGRLQRREGQQGRPGHL
jgi:hypothetical protein